MHHDHPTTGSPATARALGILFALNSQKLPANPKSDSSSDRRGAAAVCNMEPDLKYTALLKPRPPKITFPLSGWPELPPQCLPFSKGFLSSSTWKRSSVCQGGPQATGRPPL